MSVEPIGDEVERAPVQWRRAGSIVASGMTWQVSAVLAAWVYLCALHWDNDGLWFQGDAPRHAANGLFWKDFLQAPRLDAKGYALSYFARYPVINPTSYPPAFYILEGAAFGAFGPSPRLAKGLVLAFALMAAAYTTAWLRRWVAPGAGALGALVPMLPGMVTWSHAIMLNVPAFALSMAALYHARRWLDAPGSRQIYPAAVLGVVAILCYIPSAVLVFVLVAWLIALRRWRVLLQPRTLAVASACAMALLPWMMVVLRGARGHVEMTKPAPRMLAAPSNWGIYARHAHEEFGWGLLAMAGWGVVAGLAGRRWRRETILLLIWLGVAYAVLSYLRAKEPRYLLPMAAPLTVLCAIAIFATAGWLDRATERPASRGVVPAAISAVLIAQAWQAWNVRVPAIRGFGEVVAFLGRVAPDEPLFYEGYYNGVFTFLVRAGDPEYRRQVVRGDKLLYDIPLYGAMGSREFVASTGDVVEALRERSGCRWLAIERATGPPRNAASRFLRGAVRGPGFELVRSFPIVGDGADQVDVYRTLGPVERPDRVDLPLQLLGAGARLRVRPIPRRAASL